MQNLDQRKTDSHRLNQIASIANAEPLGSIYYYAHAGLMAFAGLSAIVFFDLWWLSGFVVAYIILLTLEKQVATWAKDRQVPQLYGLIIALLFIRALTYNFLILAAWTIDGDVFKLAALALLIAATINIFVFHATHMEVIACVVIPIWMCLGTLTWLIFQEFGASINSTAALLIFLCVSLYFYIALLQANKMWSALEDTQNALIQSQKQDALGKLVSGVAHDFNNILAVTLGSAELIKSVPNAEKDALADEIITSAERGAALAGQLLAFGRRSHLAPAAHDIADVFESLQTMLARVLPGNIETRFSILPLTPPVFADRQQLETALLNLVINAKDAMPDGGALEVAAGRFDHSHQDAGTQQSGSLHADNICIRVTDKGMGVAKQIQSDVFDPFFTTKVVGEGSGLGLSMVLGFARQSGGEVRFQSTLGEGTMVSLFLPAGHAGQSRHSQPERRKVLAGSARILLVEDQAPLRTILRRQLVVSGYDVVVAGNADEADRLLLAGEQPDILVTDLVMPGALQGVDLALRARKRITNLPIVLISGYPEGALSADNAAVLNQGATSPVELLRKPVRKHRLLAAIERALPGD